MTYLQLSKGGSNPNVHQQKNEQNVVYTYYYSAIKWNEVLKHATSWGSLENIMLARQNQTQKVIYCMVPLI